MTVSTVVEQQGVESLAALAAQVKKEYIAGGIEQPSVSALMYFIETIENSSRGLDKVVAHVNFLAHSYDFDLVYDFKAIGVGTDDVSAKAFIDASPETMVVATVRGERISDPKQLALQNRVGNIPFFMEACAKATGADWNGGRLTRIHPFLAAIWVLAVRFTDRDQLSIMPTMPTYRDGVMVVKVPTPNYILTITIKHDEFIKVYDAFADRYDEVIRQCQEQQQNVIVGIVSPLID